MTNTLEASTSSPDSDLTNNIATLVTTIEAPEPKLAISPTGPTLMVNQGDSGDLVIPDAGTQATPMVDGQVTGDGGTIPLGEGGIQALRESACAGWSVATEPMPPVLMLVVDASGSMIATAPSSGGRTKWEVTRDALASAVTDLPATVASGMLCYPNFDPGTSAPAYTEPQSPEACVDVSKMISIDHLGPSQGTHRQDILGAIANVAIESYEPGTPTHDACRIAYRELRDTDLPGNKHMVLVTDGSPTYWQDCVGDGQAVTFESTEEIIVEVGHARAAGISTFIIGSPGSERTYEQGADARPWLSRAAEAGGTAAAGCAHDGAPQYCHFDMVDEPDFGEALRHALSSIALQVVSCEYGLPEPPPGEELNAGAVNVVYTTGGGEELLVLPNGADDCQEGWQYSEDGTQVVLCEQTCDEVLADADARLELMFGCATGVLIE